MPKEKTKVYDCETLALEEMQLQRDIHKMLKALVSLACGTKLLESLKLEYVHDK